MIDSCGLHIGCFLTCTSGVNTLSVDLLATVSGTHQIEYHFLSRVIRFDIEATIGLPFEIPTIHFNESGDARIKIVLPDGSYYTHTVGTSVYDTFYLTVRQSTDTNFIPTVIPPGVPFATQAYVDAAIAALGIPFIHSLVEQVWPFEKWIGGLTIYCRTWDLGANAFGTPLTLSGLDPLDVGLVTWNQLISTYAGGTGSTSVELGSAGAEYGVTPPSPTLSNFITLWYTKV